MEVLSDTSSGIERLNRSSGSATLSRPLQTKLLGEWRLQLWVPKGLHLSEAKAVRAFEQRQLPLVLAREMAGLGVLPAAEWEACLICDSFLDSRAALEGEKVAALLPDFLAPARTVRSIRVRLAKIDGRAFHIYLAWNPRFLRLNPHAVRKRDWMANALSKQMAG